LLHPFSALISLLKNGRNKNKRSSIKEAAFVFYDDDSMTAMFCFGFSSFDFLLHVLFVSDSISSPLFLARQ
jgi:hypothetical protein